MEDVLRRALAYIQSQQAADGSFAGYSSRTAQPFVPERQYATVFTPATILGALADIPEAQAVRGPLAAWLLAQRSGDWSFNYWARAAPERQAMPYPDDLDDTFCSITALYRHDQALVGSGSLGKIIHILLAAETQVGGPYRTWLADRQATAVWQDTDLAVNANVAYFLRTVAEPLPNLTALMDEAIATNRYMSPYYPGPLPVLYFIARAYTGQHHRQLAAAIQELNPRTALERALWCSALLRLGEYRAVRPVLEMLCAAQKPDGSWPAEAFCLDPARQGSAYYHGSSALTTALAAEAIHAYIQQPAGGIAATAMPSREYNQIITRAKAGFGHLAPDLRAICQDLADTMAKGDTSQEIVLLPQLFARSLPGTPPIPDEPLIQLSLANIYGWMAYTVFDDFLDNEGTPRLLPAATAALRASQATFQQAVPDTGFQKLVTAAFDSIDNANAWETAHCRAVTGNEYIILERIPHYGQLRKLAERSLGHALTPLGVLVLAGHRPHSSAVRNMQESLRHYLVARQLHDDLHDWERDVRAGQLNAVVAEILRQLRLQPGRYDFTRLLPRMQAVFWQHVLPQMCNRCLAHMHKARRAAVATGVIVPDSPFYALYDRLEAATRHTLDSQAEALKFLAGYKKPPA